MNETGYQTDPAGQGTAGETTPAPQSPGAGEGGAAASRSWWRRLLPLGGRAGQDTSDDDMIAAGTAAPPDGAEGVRDPGVPGHDQPGSPSLLSRWSWVLPWVLVALALAVAVTSTWQWQQLAAEERQRDEVAQSAGTFMLTLTNWDATEGMGAVREELRAHGTQRFAGEVDELFGTTEDLRELADIGARSDGEVRRFFVQELDDDRAVALVVLVQRLVTDVTEGEEVSVRYAELDLLRRDSTWLVDEVELLVDVAQQEAQPIAPNAEDAQEAP